jgi:invasion protein IalB
MKKLLSLLLIGLLPLGAFAEDAKKEIPTFGDWAKQCEKDGDKEMCYIFQTLTVKITARC